MKKKIRIKMIDYNWAGFVPEKEYIYQLLDRMYDVEMSDDPDYLIDGCFGYDHLKYDHHCIRILSNGENLACDFNLFDYAVGQQYMTFGDRYERIPHFATYPEYLTLGSPYAMTDDALLNRKFCSFVVSNFLGDTFRDDFFKRLSEYKPVDSGGRHLNNVGGSVADKLGFCRGYKFNIAFENSVSPGYTTEKVMQPMTVGSVPIYFGDPLVGQDFNPDSMVIVKDRSDVERAVEEIVYLDTHDDAYLAKCRAAKLMRPVGYFEERYCAFLRHIIEQPIDQAKRLSRYGFQSMRRRDLKRMHDEHVMLHMPINTVKKIKRYIWKKAGITK